MSFVFVSHANPDKSLIRHIVDALIADGHKVWLDNPAAMGYGSEDIRLYFIRLHAGGRWQHEIDEAIQEAGAVLVCFSKRYNEPRDVWHDEAAVARTLGTLLACRIDDVDPQSLRNQYSAQQMPDLRPGLSDPDRERALASLVEDVRRMLERNARAGLYDRRKTLPLDPDAPYLIDRTPHEEKIGDGIEIVDRDKRVHAFIVAGPENECVDKFIDRLRSRTCLKRLKGRSWHPLVFEWPEGQRGVGFFKTYLRRCAEALGQPPDTDENGIAKALADKGKPVAVLSLMYAAQWQGDEDKRLCDWLQLWRRIANQPHRFSALPILSLILPPAEPGWRDCPGGTAPGAVMSNAAIWRAVRGLEKRPSRWTLFGRPQPPARAAIGVPPLLHPVDRGHADIWLAQPEISGQIAPDIDNARMRIKNLFDGRATIALETFALGMKPLFRGSTAI